MAVQTVLKMGDPRLLRIALPVEAFGTPELRALLDDLFDTMRATDGVGIAAPQIGIDLQVVIFGFSENPRYPEENAVPETVLINPVLTVVDDDEEDGWEGCLSVPGLRGAVPRWKRIRYTGFDFDGETCDQGRSELPQTQSYLSADSEGRHQ